MAVLFRYELRKLLNRRLVWVLLGAITLLTIWGNWSILQDKFSGKVDGMRAAYSAYEGRFANDSLHTEIKTALQRYVSANPSEFTAYTNDNTVEYHPKNDTFPSGMWNALTDIGNLQTAESRKKDAQEYQRYIDEGKFEDGRVLTPYEIRFYNKIVAPLQEPIMVHYTEGWKLLSWHLEGYGYYILAMLALGLFAIFSGESTAKSEGMILCTAKRGHVAAAKMLAALCYSVMITVMIYGLPVGISAMTYGLDGAIWPAVTLDGWIPYIHGASIGAVFVITTVLTVEAAMACAAVIALASSLFRHPLTALLGCIAFLGLLFLPYALGILLANHDSSGNLIFTYLYAYSEFLPTPVLANGSILSYSLDNIQSWIIGLLIPAVVGGLACFLAPRQFLRRRKA